MIGAHGRLGRRLIRPEPEFDRARDLIFGAAAEHHPHHSADAGLAPARGHRGETRRGRDVHFIAFFGSGGLLRRARNGGEHRGDGGDGNETQSRTHAILPVARDPPTDDATETYSCLDCL